MLYANYYTTQMKKRTEDSVLKEKIEQCGGEFIASYRDTKTGKRNGKDVVRHRINVEYYCKCQLDKPIDMRTKDTKNSTSVMINDTVCCIKCGHENVKKTNLKKYGTEYYTDILNKNPDNGKRVSEGIKSNKESVIGPMVNESEEKIIDYDEDIMEHLEDIALQRQQTCVDYCMCHNPNSDRVGYYVAIICKHTEDGD